MRLSKGRKVVYSLIFLITINMALLNIHLLTLWTRGYGLKESINKHDNKEFEQPPNVWFDADRNNNDRIEDQMRFIPMSVLEKLSKNETIPFKSIFIYNGNPMEARNAYIYKQCAVNYCKVMTNFRLINEADLVLTMQKPLHRPEGSPAHQIWVMFLLESPHNAVSLKGYFYNWTATYRHDSDIVTPYEKFILHHPTIHTRIQNKNYAEGKTKKVAWFLSNCASNNRRWEYAYELGRYIQVDIYGRCGKLKCPRTQRDKCFEMLSKDYKFYLAFENSNCRDYITEKFFVNGLKNDVLPIVMGAAPEDYERVAPQKSFIHVDGFESPKHLAKYLNILDKNDTLYNEYFMWKGTGSFVNTMFWCRLCAMAHEAQFQKPMFYEDLEKWWHGPEVCIGHSMWKETQTKKLPVSKLINGKSGY